ncbi:hypothetical protein N9S32_01530 [Candidatus Actinomarina]|nr:hypothetical protein [Candidatus Actinomarina sp.]
MSNNFDRLESIESYLSNLKWKNIKRDYNAKGISSLRSTLNIINTILEEGYTAIKHQQEVGGNYYETINEVLLGEESELLSTKDSTESDQF